jgi:hypothetical protein
MRLLLGMLCFLVCSITSAAPTDIAQRSKLAEQLVEIFGIQSTYDEAASRCMKATSALEEGLLALAANHPDRFEGIASNTVYWPEVRTIYADYMNATCSAVSGTKLRPLFVQAYAEEMTQEQLSTAITFCSSPAGREMIVRNRIVTLKITAAAAEAADAAANRATPVFLQSMAVLQAKAKQAAN